MMEKIEELLNQLIRKVPQIRAAAVVNTEGIVISSVLEGDISEENFGAMSAALLGLGDSVLSEVKGGKLSEIYVKGIDKMILLSKISKDHLLSLSISSDAPLGLLLVEVRKTAKLISSVLVEIEKSQPAVDISDLLGGDTSIIEGLSFKDLLEEWGEKIMFIDTKKKEINVKIVYYGPALSGKTTNLKVIYAKLNPKFRGELVTVDTKGERTLYFDFLPVEITLAGGFKVKFHIYTVPGQVFYRASRKLVLKGADGIVFVADSSPERREANIQIMQELSETLEEQGTPLGTVPIVLQYNKRDVPNALDVETLQADLNHLNAPYFLAVASQEKGVFETLDAIVKLVIKKLTSKAPVWVLNQLEV